MHNNQKFTGVARRRAHLKDLNAKVNGSVDVEVENYQRERKVKARVGTILDVPRRVTRTIRGELVQVHIHDVTKSMYHYTYVTREGVRHNGAVGLSSGVAAFEETLVFIS